MRLMYLSFFSVALLANFVGTSWAAETETSKLPEAAPSINAVQNVQNSKAVSSESLQATAEDILAAFKKEGLPIGETVVYSAATDPNNRLGRPGQYTGKASWVDTRVKQSEFSNGPAGGTVEVFAGQKELAARRDYIKSVQEGMPMLQQYIFESGNALLRLEFALTPDQAAEYQRVLQSFFE